MRSVRHFCSVCYKNDKVKLEHPKASSACPYFQKRLESQDNIAAETGTIPCSDIQNILSVSFDSPVDELELIKFFKTCRKFIESRHYNFECCKIPLRTKLNIPFFQFMLADYEDAAVVELLQYGFPIGFSGKLNKSLVPSRITKGSPNSQMRFLNIWKKRNHMGLFWVLLLKFRFQMGFAFLR